MKKRIATILMATTMTLSGGVLAFAETMPVMGEGMQGQMPMMGEGMEGQMPPMGEGMEGMERPEMGVGMEGQAQVAEVNPETATATQSSTNLMVNGSAVSVDAYMINGNNYIKLRDLATMINNTEKNFSVEWNAEANAISLVSNTPYTAVGGEMTLGTGEAKTANLSKSDIYVNGNLASLVAYTIEGNNYFKVRDVMLVFDVYVGWDAETSTATLDTSMGYELTDAEMAAQPPMGEGMDGQRPPMEEGMEGQMPPMGEGMEGGMPPMGEFPEELTEEEETIEEVDEE